MFPSLVAACALFTLGADFNSVQPNVFPPDDPRAKDLPKMMLTDMRERMQAANLRESRAFAKLATKADWEKYRNQRIAALRASLGTFPEAPKKLRIVETKKLEGEGFVIHNLLYESRPGLWVSANLYLPAVPVAKMPGIIIAHSHHTPKTDGELQDMGMTWARAGAAVLVPDQLGYGERRNHDFHTNQDYDKPFRAGRQDYYFRYNSNAQLSSIGESLMGWMAWDLMRGVDVLLQQKTIDAQRIILMGSVAGGGDPAGVTAALDDRIKCVVPFNFGGWQPESKGLENPDRDYAWFGDGYWESTRGLRGGAAGGFAHFDIVGSVAPRKLIYGHEFAWDAKTDPAWPRLQKIWSFYDAKDSLRVAHGKGSVRGPGGADNTHCNHIGAVHRKMIYPALKDMFEMPIPEEYSNRKTRDELTCWTKEARQELRPKKLHGVIAAIAQTQPIQKQDWATRLGNIEPNAERKIIPGKSEEVPGGTLVRMAIETDPGIVVPLLLITPSAVKGKVPVVVMVAQHGKQAFLKERSEAIAALLKAKVAVCLVDVRGTGETRAGSSAERGSTRTSISQTNLILGQPVLGSQLRDLRSVLNWLKQHEAIDGKKLAIWGDSFAKVNAKEMKLAVPLDVESPAVSEPNGANLALLAGLLEENIVAIYTRGSINDSQSIVSGPYFYRPHESVILGLPELPATLAKLKPKLPVLVDATVDAQNRSTSTAKSGAEIVEWLIAKLR